MYADANTSSIKSGVTKRIRTSCVSLGQGSVRSAHTGLGADRSVRAGDVGEFTGHGALKIIDRKKNIFKLSQGRHPAAPSYPHETPLRYYWHIG